MGKMTLNSISSVSTRSAVRILVYGVEGVGKTTFAACAPNPVFIGPETGTMHVSVARFPKPESWEDIQEALDVLAKEDHTYETVVIDSLDWLEPLCWDFVCRIGSKKSIEEFGYGKGYVVALDEWRRLIAKLDKIKDKGVNVILIAHATIKTFHDPSTEDYDRYVLKLHDKAAGLIKEWCDIVLFANFETFAKKDQRKAVSNGDRIAKTQHGASWDAKNRYKLPEQIPLDWTELENKINLFNPEQASVLFAEIQGLIHKLPPEKRANARKAAIMAGHDVAELTRIINKINEVTSK